MRKGVLVWSMIWLLPLWGAAVKGDGEATKLTEKLLAALGGKEGLAKRRMLYVEQQAHQELPGGAGVAFTATVCLWQKGDKRRMEQRIGQAPGSPNVIIYNGEELFLLVNGARRDPGPIVKKTFLAGKKREDLFWDCLTKPLRVENLGVKEIQKKKLTLLQFTHSDGDTTLVGLDPATHLPYYMKYKAPHPYTGKDVAWVQWQHEFKPMKEADGLVFPLKAEVYHGDQKMWTATTVKVELQKTMPDSLFGKDRPVD